MNRWAGAALVVLGVVASSAAGTGRNAAVDVVVERKAGAEWTAVDPHYVFAAQDQIRFVFRSGVAGHLYVLNRAPSGASDWIFPAANTTPENRVAPGQAYRIPAQGAFVISGPPGFDTTVWILSPHPLPMGAAADLLPDQPAETPRGERQRPNPAL